MCWAPIGHAKHLQCKLANVNGKGYNINAATNIETATLQLAKNYPVTSLSIHGNWFFVDRTVKCDILITNHSNILIPSDDNTCRCVVVAVAFSGDGLGSCLRMNAYLCGI